MAAIAQKNNLFATQTYLKIFTWFILFSCISHEQK